MLSWSGIQATEIKWDIKGQLIEESTGETIPYANVVLYLKSDSSIVMGTTTNFDGEFILEKIPANEYYITLSFIGFEDKIIDRFHFDPNNRLIDLGQLTMGNAITQLDEFEVSATIAKRRRIA